MNTISVSVSANQNTLGSGCVLTAGPTLFSVTLETDVVLLPELSQEPSLLLKLSLKSLQDGTHLGGRGRSSYQ